MTTDMHTHSVSSADAPSGALSLSLAPADEDDDDPPPVSLLAPPATRLLSPMALSLCLYFGGLCSERQVAERQKLPQSPRVCSN